MKVITLKKFKDLKENKTRNIGDEFIVNKERFTEIETALSGYIKEVKEEKEESESTETDQDTKPKK